MPDYKVYIPEAKAPLLYQYKEQFGKDASSMIVGFMEKALTNAGQIGRQTPAASTAHDIYQIYFGDIESENAFLYLFETRESAGFALKNRTDILCRKHPDICSDVMEQFKKTYPKLAKITGITT